MVLRRYVIIEVHDRLLIDMCDCEMADGAALLYRCPGCLGCFKMAQEIVVYLHVNWGLL